jgi:hypothetical protein
VCTAGRNVCFTRASAALGFRVRLLGSTWETARGTREDHGHPRAQLRKRRLLCADLRTTVQDALTGNWIRDAKTIAKVFQRVSEALNEGAHCRTSRSKCLHTVPFVVAGPCVACTGLGAGRRKARRTATTRRASTRPRLLRRDCLSRLAWSGERDQGGGLKLPVAATVHGGSRRGAERSSAAALALIPLGAQHASAETNIRMSRGEPQGRVGGGRPRSERAGGQTKRAAIAGAAALAGTSRQLGFREGQNVSIEYRWANDQIERLSTLAGMAEPARRRKQARTLPEPVVG